MAATRKSPKRSAKKKSQSKQKSSKKKSAKAAGSKARSAKKTARSRATALERRARKGLGVAREGFDSVLEAGGKTWRTLKKTTSQMVEGVKDTLAGDAETPRRPPRAR
jgi:hypothetical protein